MRFQKQLSDTYIKWCLVGFSLIIISLPFLVRFMIFHQHLVPNVDTYGDMLKIKELSESSSSRVFSSSYTLYHYSMYALYLLFNKSNLELIMLIVPIVLGALSMLLWYSFLETRNLNPVMKQVSSFMLFLSPIFLYVFTISSFLTFLCFLILLTLFLLTRKNILLQYTTLVPLFAAGTLSLYTPWLIIAFYWYEVYKKKHHTSREQPRYFSLVMDIGAGITVISSIFVFKAYQISLYPLENMNLFQNNVTDLGAILGFGAFTLVLFLVGFYYALKQKNNILLVVVVLALLTLLSYHYSKYRILLNIVITLGAGYGFIGLYQRKWDVALLKNLCLFMLILGILFSGLSFVNRIIDMHPSLLEIEQLTLLKEHVFEGKILSHEENGFLINYYMGENKAFFDKRTNNASKQKIADTIFHSRSIELTMQLLHEQGITYLFITDRMKAGQVWKKDNDGLLFLLEKSEKFKKIYTAQGVEIWEVRG